MFEEDEDLVTCPGCGVWQHVTACLLGMLGKRAHYRCRYCGMEWSVIEADRDVSN